MHVSPSDGRGEEEDQWALAPQYWLFHILATCQTNAIFWAAMVVARS